jgi:hypothetical protein
MNQSEPDVNSSVIPLPVLKRNNYFYGKLLTVTDFQQEQNYFINKQRLINRTLFGMGVVTGLKVTAADSGCILQLSEGFALDGYGREIVLTKPMCLDINSKYTTAEIGLAKDLFVSIEYDEKKTDPIPQSLGTGEPAMQYNMIVEGAKTEISLAKPDSLDKVFLAKVSLKRGNNKILVCKIDDSARSSIPFKEN